MISKNKGDKPEQNHRYVCFHTIGNGILGRAYIQIKNSKEKVYGKRQV